MNIIDKINTSFVKNGYIRILNVFSKSELGEIGAEIEKVKQIAETLPKKLVWFSPSSKGGLMIQRISLINQYSALIDDIGRTHPDLLRISAQLLNVDNVRFADGSEGSDGAVLVVKSPDNMSKHRELRWHRDANFTQHLPINPFINLGIYLDDSGFKMGGLVVVPSSHRNLIFNESLAETTQHHPGEICVTAQRGDIVIHSYQLWHCSRHYKKASGQRRILYFNYYPL